MANPEEPEPPNEGGEQDADSIPESSGFDASSGSEKTTAGEPAAPPSIHVADKPASIESAAALPDHGHTQDREASDPASEPAPEPVAEALEPPAGPESAIAAFDAVLATEPVADPPVARGERAPAEAIEALPADEPEPQTVATFPVEPKFEIAEPSADGVPEQLVSSAEPEPEPEPELDEPARPDGGEPEAIASDLGAETAAAEEPAPIAAFENVAPAGARQVEEPTEASSAIASLDELAPIVASQSPASEAPPTLVVPDDVPPAADDVDAPAEPKETTPLAAFDVAPDAVEIEGPPIEASAAPNAAFAPFEPPSPEPSAAITEAATAFDPEPIVAAADDIEEAAPEPTFIQAQSPAPAVDQLSALEAPPNDPALFVESPSHEESAADAALFPATPARDEAVLFTQGVETVPEVVAEIIPYVPPAEAPAQREIESATNEDTTQAAPVAARAPEDLAAPPLPAQPSPLGAAFGWIGAQTGAALFWLRSRLPKGKEKPETPTGPIPSRRRTHWPSHQRAPDARSPAFRPNIRKIAIMSGWAAVIITASIAGLFIYLTRDMPSTRSLWTADNSPSLTFVDRRGRVIIREGAENAPPVDLKRIPAYVPQAMIAIEDRRFYEHFGVDLNGLMRAAASNMKAGHVVQGGSTITQQLAKNLFLTNNRTFQRKVQEVALALWLESQFSKRDILALYMSRVYFGAGAYGVEAAAERYFDKPAKNLTLAEAALLAGLVKAPSKLNPAAQVTAAKARAKIVLDEMLSAGFINAAQHKTALNAPLTISPTNPNGNLGYFRDWIDPQLNQVLGDQRDDFVIETTLDLDAQRAAEETLRTVIERERKARNVSQGAVLAMDSTGGVTTMVGGLNYGKGPGQSEFNRTTQSLRAPGSSFKYFIYMAAMAKGMNPWQIYVDKPVVYGDWAPGNYEDKYYGPVTLAAAYAKSLNMVAIQLANDVSGKAVIDTARSLGVGKRLEDYRSLGLGAQGMTVMEMVTGYGAMASGGYPIEPHGIERVRRANGQVLWARRPASPPRQVIDDRTMRMMNYLGTGVVRAGTGTRAQIPGREIAGKTGTSNDYRDAWFIGYVPGMVAGVWLGNDNNTSMTKVTGGLLSSEVWHDFMVVALRDTPIQQLAMPETEELPLPAESGEVTEVPAPSLATAPPLAPEAPPPAIAVTPVGGDG